MNTPKKTSPLPVYLALVLLTVFAVVFVIEFINLSQPEEGEVVEIPQPDSYLSEVEALLENADAFNGSLMLQKHGCTNCHQELEVNRLAPSFNGVATRAAERRAPMTAAAYLYEAIIHPQAFEVRGYIGQMPQIFKQQIPENELGDIIAYLLTLKF
jgi:cytochrome c551/c552